MIICSKSANVLPLQCTVMISILASTLAYTPSQIEGSSRAARWESGPEMNVLERRLEQLENAIGTKIDNLSRGMNTALEDLFGKMLRLEEKLTHHELNVHQQMDRLKSAVVHATSAGLEMTASLRTENSMEFRKIIRAVNSLDRRTSPLHGKREFLSSMTLVTSRVNASFTDHLRNEPYKQTEQQFGSDGPQRQVSKEIRTPIFELPAREKTTSRFFNKNASHQGKGASRSSRPVSSQKTESYERAAALMDEARNGSAMATDYNRMRKLPANIVASGVQRPAELRNKKTGGKDTARDQAYIDERSFEENESCSKVAERLSATNKQGIDMLTHKILNMFDDIWQQGKDQAGVLANISNLIQTIKWDMDDGFRSLILRSSDTLRHSPTMVDSETVLIVKELIANLWGRLDSMEKRFNEIQKNSQARIVQLYESHQRYQDQEHQWESTIIDIIEKLLYYVRDKSQAFRTDIQDLGNLVQRHHERVANLILQATTFSPRQDHLKQFTTLQKNVDQNSDDNSKPEDSVNDKELGTNPEQSIPGFKNGADYLSRQANDDDY